MKQTFQEFIETWNGKYLEVAGTPNALNQCTDLANAYLRDVLNHPIIEWTNARDFPSKLTDFDWIQNTPDGVPQEGDIIVWQNNTYGHIAVFVEGTASSFRSFDENWPTGSPCHIQNHTYIPEMCWGRPKQQEQMAVITQKELDEIRLRRDELYNLWDADEKTIKNLNTTIDELRGQVSSKDKELLLLRNENKMLMDQAEKMPLLVESNDDLNKKNIALADEIVSLNRSISQKDRRYEELKGNAPKLFLEWVVSKIEKWKKR